MLSAMADLPPIPDAPPMQPVPWPRAFTDSDWGWQVKWDGLRCLAAIGAGGARLFGRHLQPYTDRFAELAADLPGQLAADSALLDGEIVALDPRGRPCFHEVLRRSAGRPGGGPLVLVVFDLLHLAGNDLRACPLRQRWQYLESAVRPGRRLHVAASGLADGPGLLAAVERAGLEGVVAKRLASPYRSGHRPDWRKIKPRRRTTALVAGAHRTPDGRVRALSLMAYAAGEPVYLGDVASGLTQPARALAATLLAHAPTATPPPGAPRDHAHVWTAPVLLAEVSYAEATAAGRLRHPALQSLHPPGNLRPPAP